MQQALAISDAVAKLGAKFAQRSARRKNAGKFAVSFVVEAVNTGVCPSCKRKVR